MDNSIQIGFITADMRDFPASGLYVITDSDRLDYPTLYQRTKAILKAGVPVLQYRDKTATREIRHDRARALLDLCDKHGTLFLVNDDVQLAQDTGADGVHVGQEDTPYPEARQLLGEQAFIGISCYNRLEPALAAQSQGADYIAFGAFYSTRTKNQTTPARPELLRRARPVVSIPIVAIGGITPENGGELLQAGADLLAVASSVYNSVDPTEVVLKFNKMFQ